LAVVHSVAKTCQRDAAALTSMARATAPAWRIGSVIAIVLVLPPVIWMP
jgi:hypothetical protein